MNPHNPSRRRLLGGLVAGLFGWLLPSKAQATASPSPTQPESAGGLSRIDADGRMTSICYDGKGQSFAYSSGQLISQGGTLFSYDGTTGVTTIRHF